MFDLRFHKTVAIVLAWQEAPGCAYSNAHQDALAKRNPPEHNMCSFSSVQELQLSVYIKETYPAYFGLNLRVGKAAELNSHRILNCQFGLDCA
jgi:hypothetical protein